MNAQFQPLRAASFPAFVVDTSSDIEIIKGQVSFSIAYQFDKGCYVSGLINATEKRVEEYVGVDGNAENDRPTVFYAYEIKKASWSDPYVDFAIVTDFDDVAVIENQSFQLTDDQTDRLNELLLEMARDAHFEQLKAA